jgi:hypothetical protein
LFTVLKVLIRSSARRKCRKGGGIAKPHHRAQGESDVDVDCDGDVIIA